MKLLIIGHCRHGKDTVAQMITDMFGLTFISSSEAAADLFIFDALKEKYGYKTVEECFKDRVNHRKEWYDLITEFNSSDKARLAKGILKHSDMYVGMRDHEEIQECIRQGLFDYIIGVYDPRKPHEPKESFNIDLFEEADLIIPNASSLGILESKVHNVIGKLVEK